MSKPNNDSKSFDRYPFDLTKPVFPQKKLTFDEWADLKQLKNPSVQRDAMRLAWEAGQENK